MGSKIGNTDVAIIISYKLLFDDFDDVNIEELITGIPTKLILQIISNFDSQYYMSEINNQIQMGILRKWMTRFPSNIKQKIYYSLNENRSENIIFFNNIPSLQLIQYSLNYYFEGNLRELSPEEELRLF